MKNEGNNEELNINVVSADGEVVHSITIPVDHSDDADTIDFTDIGRKKTAVYVISSDTHTAYDFLLTIFFSQMIQQLYDFADKNGGKLKVPCFFILDEFANIGKIPDFDKKISTSRSRKISFSVILQNLDQLEAIYEKSHETIVGNCDTHVFLGSNSFKTVEYFSKELGEKTIKRKSDSINRDSNKKKTGTSESEQIMARALMTPDELRRMDNDYCIIFEKGLLSCTIIYCAFSFAAMLLYIIVGAADVAFTEAVIGTISTVYFVIAIKSINRRCK